MTAFQSGGATYKPACSGDSRQLLRTSEEAAPGERAGEQLRPLRLHAPGANTLLYRNTYAASSGKVGLPLMLAPATRRHAAVAWVAAAHPMLRPNRPALHRQTAATPHVSPTEHLLCNVTTIVPPLTLPWRLPPLSAPSPAASG